MSFQSKEGVIYCENISKKCGKNICVSQRPNLVLNAAEQIFIDWKNQKDGNPKAKTKYALLLIIFKKLDK